VLSDLFQADVIMALAGSNGGSWSTTYSPKPTASPGSESYMTSGGEYELRGRLSVTGNATRGVGSSDRISTPTGEYSYLSSTMSFAL
jgi:hypothetical protein